jgi:hypothetical protein
VKRPTNSTVAFTVRSKLFIYSGCIDEKRLVHRSTGALQFLSVRLTGARCYPEVRQILLRVYDHQTPHAQFMIEGVLDKHP